MSKTEYNRREPANVRNMLIVLSLVFLIAFASYRSFLEKSKEVESFDEFAQRLGEMRVSITQLEYLMDMFVVAGRFENTTVGMITGDVKKIDDKVSGSLGQKRYMQLIKSNGPIYDNAASISGDWSAVKRDIARLNSTFSKDELLLLHNAVDMNTVLIIEKIDRLLAGIAERRVVIFLELKSLALYNITGFILVSLVCALFVFKRLITPINSMVRSAEKVVAGESGVRFGEDGGNVGYLGSKLNAMLGATEAAGDEKNARIESLVRELNNRTRQIEAINIIMSFAGRSLSQNELYSVAAKETTATGCADAAVIYISDDDVLKPRATSGLGDSTPADFSLKMKDLMAGRSDLSGSVIFKSVEEYPDQVLRVFFASGGFSSVVSVPISYNNEVAGFFIAAYKERMAVPGNRLFFLESIATSLGVSTGHVSMFQKEFNFRRFYERILQQEPFGVIVLDRAGSCLFANAALKRFFGADPKFNFVSHYRIFEDESLMKAEFKSPVLKTFEGFVSEFEINYDPSSMLRLGFMGEARKLSVKTRPLFDPGGEITCILIVFAECGGVNATASSSGEK